MLPNFFSKNVIAITMKFTWVIHTYFAIMKLFSHKVSVVFNTNLPTLSKMLYNSVAKFPASLCEKPVDDTSLAAGLTVFLAGARQCMLAGRRKLHNELNQ
jgi:hypothetical protein